MEYKTLLFDADGTLFDFLKCEKTALAESLDTLKVKYDDSVLLRYSAINDMLWKKLEKCQIEKKKLVTERFCIFVDEYKFDIDPYVLSDLYKENLSHQMYVMKNSVELLERLYGKYRIYIITNGIKKVQESRLKISPITKFLDGVFISEEMGAEKPSKMYFDKVASLIKDFKKEEALVIGDSLSSDIKGGNNAGIDTCLYAPFGYDFTSEIKPKYVVDDLIKILDILA